MARVQRDSKRESYKVMRDFLEYLRDKKLAPMTKAMQTANLSHSMLLEYVTAAKSLGFIVEVMDVQWSTGRSPRYVVTDRGCEFISDYDAFLRKYGLKGDSRWQA